MDADKVVLWAEAKRLGVPDYRKMGVDELRVVIEDMKHKNPSAKGKAAATSANGAKGKTAASAAVKGKVSAAPAKGKGKPATSTAKSAPAGKSTARKPATKRTAAQGKATRPTTGGRGKATAVRQARATTTKPRTTRSRTAAAESYRQTIDNKAVKWNLPSNVGKNGKRKIVLDSLRSNKGDKAKVFSEVKRYATKWYPDKDKDAADRMVVWLIGRVALDYVVTTGQHESGKRVGYGQSTKPNDIRRREQRAAASAARKPATRKRAAQKPAAATKAPTRGKVVAKGKGRR